VIIGYNGTKMVMMMGGDSERTLKGIGSTEANWRGEASAHVRLSAIGVHCWPTRPRVVDQGCNNTSSTSEQGVEVSESLI